MAASAAKIQAFEQRATWEETAKRRLMSMLSTWVGLHLAEAIQKYGQRNRFNVFFKLYNYFIASENKLYREFVTKAPPKEKIKQLKIQRNFCVKLREQASKLYVQLDEYPDFERALNEIIKLLNKITNEIDEELKLEKAEK